MRDLRATLVFALVLAPIAACGGGSSDTPDATIKDDAPPDTAPPPDMMPDGPQFDFSCMGNAAPADGTATDPIAVTGTVSDINLVAQMLEPVDGADVFGVVTAMRQATDEHDLRQNRRVHALAGEPTPTRLRRISRSRNPRPVAPHDARVPAEPAHRGRSRMVPALLLSESNFIRLVNKPA